MAKKEGPLIDPKLLKQDVYDLFVGSIAMKGTTPEEAAALLAKQDRYAVYPADYLQEWTKSMLDKLDQEDQNLDLINGRYYLGGPAAGCAG